MSYPINQLDITPDWKGLYVRTQQLPDDDPHLYAQDAHNVEFYGSVMRKRLGTFLLNGIWDVFSAAWAAGSAQPPPLWFNWNWGQVAYMLHIGTTFKVFVWAPGDPNQWATLTFTITAIDAASGIPTVTPVPTYDIPQGSLVMCLPDTQDRRIGGLFQGRFRNGAEPILVDTVHTTTGEFKLHLQGNRQCLPFNLYQRMPKTTVASWGPVFNVGCFLASTEGLQAGMYIHFPNAQEGNRNARVSFVSDIDHRILLDGADNIVIPIPVAGDPVYFYPNTCPPRVGTPPDPPLPGSGKLSASHMGNRTIMAMPGMTPLCYAHSQSDTVSGMPLAQPYQTFFLVKGFDPSLVGRQIVISDIADPDGIGQVYLRTLSAVSGTQITVTPPLPVHLGPGGYVDVVSVSRVGLGAPVLPPTIAPGTGGQMQAGSVTVRVTFAINPVYPAGTQTPQGSAYVESEACKASLRVTVADGGTLVVTGIPQPLDPRVSEIRLYRTAVGGDGVWYYMGSVPVGTTSFTNTKGETSGLGALLPEFVNYPPYDTMEVVVEWPHAQRLMGIARVGTNAWAVVWSDGPDAARQQVRPESWPVDNFLFVGNDSGDRPRGIAAFFDSMLVFCERSIWRVQGNPPDLVVEPVNFQQHDQSGIGVQSHQSIVTDQNEVIFPGPDGVYLLDRFQGVATGFQSQRISRQIDGLWEETAAARRTRIHAVFLRSRRQYRLFWPLGSGSGEPDTILVYQFDADINGAPHYWSEWSISRGPELKAALVTASAIIRPEPGDGWLFASVNEAAYIGTVEGAILGMDFQGSVGSKGFTDHSTMPFPMVYSTLPFGPAGGMASPALGRFLHLALHQEDIQEEALPSTFWTPLQVQVFACNTGAVPIREEGETPGASITPTVSIDLPANGAYGELQFSRLVLLARGQYHQIRVRDLIGLNLADPIQWQLGNDRPVEIHRMAYFFQRLPEATIPETHVQSEPTD